MSPEPAAHRSSVPSPPILPVLIITGFLGSGKTTLLNRLLRDRPRSAVIVNEFGSVPIDQKLLESTGAPLAVLSGGCMCCQIRNATAPLLKNLWMAWREQRPFDLVLIETSGVASPGPVIETLLRDHWLSRRFRLQGVVATVSAAGSAHHLERFPESVAQIALADALLVTQSDLAASDEVASLNQELDRIAPSLPRLCTHPDAVGFDSLNRLLARAHLPIYDPGDTLEHSFCSVTVHMEGHFDWPSIQSLLSELIQRHATTLLRIKGLIELADGRLVVVQAAANRLFEPIPVPRTDSNAMNNQLVFIGSADLDAIARAVTASLASLASAPSDCRLH